MPNIDYRTDLANVTLIAFKFIIRLRFNGLFEIFFLEVAEIFVTL